MTSSAADSKPVKSSNFMKKMAMKKRQFGNNEPPVVTEEQAKVTPPSIDSKQHQGNTAGFAIEETYKIIQAKLESAQRRSKEGFTKKNVKVFEPNETIPEEELEPVFKKPVSGRSSRAKNNIVRSAE
jgi:hypothetical protein